VIERKRLGLRKVRCLDSEKKMKEKIKDPRKIMTNLERNMSPFPHISTILHIMIYGPLGMF